MDAADPAISASGREMGVMKRRLLVQRVVAGVALAERSYRQETAFNPTTAKALGVTLSPAMLRRADEVFG
jgi:ABC-type uncharacterized transport system substrate-binding protein